MTALSRGRLAMRGRGGPAGSVTLHTRVTDTLDYRRDST
jgi:hypothetical protein